jgi:serine protease Do
MNRILVSLAALALLGGAVACTDDGAPSTSSTAGTTAPAAQATQGAQSDPSAQYQPPSRGQSAAASLGDDANPNAVVKAIRPSVVRIRAGGQQQGVFGAVARGEGTGTGFIVDARGHVVTNNHVVTLGTDQPANQIEVDLWDGRTVQGRLVGRDERTDLAVIKIEGDNLTPLRFADTTRTEVGEEVLAIGFALDLGAAPTVTKGVVSAKDRVIDETLNAGGRPYAVSISGAIQTDAAINPGNSGGPLVNLRGEVVGVNTAGLFAAGGQPVQGIFFAVAAQVAEPIVRALIETGRVDRGYLGVVLASIDRDVARAQNLQVESGAGLREVTSGSPAERAGLRVGDIITKVGDREVKNVGDVTNALTGFRPGQTVKVEYVRNGRPASTDVTLGERPAGVR